MSHSAPNQFYITHCSKADSVTGTAGFSVRAASTADPTLLRTAFALPAYELPMELWAKRPGRASAPRRLARLLGADGATWILHTAYLEKDTTNRDRCYFTHALSGLPHTPADVLQSWGDGWATDYPLGATKRLAPPDSLEPGGRIDDSAVERFLTGHADDESLSLMVAPRRLVADRSGCRRLIEHFLAAVLAASGEASPGRTRVFVHAEPGLVALLVYTATRLLPADIAHDLTFTTYEPPHRNSHEFKLATIIGTYTAHPKKGLDQSRYDSRGYALDTFAARQLPSELSAHAERVTPLVRLAAHGKWATIEALLNLAGPSPNGLSRLPNLLPLADAIVRLDAGRPTPADLLALCADPGGRAALADRQDLTWPHVRHHALTDADISRVFSTWIEEPDRVAEFLHTAADCLRAGDLTGARGNWGVIARTSPTHAGERLTTLLETLGDSMQDLPVEARRWLRTRCVAHPTTDVKLLRALLVPIDDDDGESIVTDASLPPTWKAFTLSVLSIQPPSGQSLSALRLLREAAPAVLAAYLHRTVAEGQDGQQQLDTLTEAHPDMAELVRKLLEADSVRPEWWSALLAHLFNVDAQAAERLASGGILGPVLAAVGSTQEFHSLWSAMADHLDGRFLDGDDSQAKEWEAMEAAIAAVPDIAVQEADELPRTVWDKLIAGRVIQQALKDPDFDLSGRTEQLHAVFLAFGHQPLDALARLYRGRYLYSSAETEPDAFRPFSQLFHACFPFNPLSFDSICGALARWCELSEHALDDARREAMQTYYIRAFLEPVVLAEVLVQVLADESRVFLAPRVRDTLMRPSR